MLFMFKDISQINQLCQEFLIVEAFGQAAAALTAHGIDQKEYANKLVYLMGVDKARFRTCITRL